MAHTFRVDGLVGAEEVGLELVVVGEAFGVPQFTATLFLDIAAEQQVAIDGLAHLAWQNTLRAV